MKTGDSENIFHAESEYVLEIVPSSTNFLENVKMGVSGRFFPVKFEYGFRFFAPYLVFQKIEFS